MPTHRMSFREEGRGNWKGVSSCRSEKGSEASLLILRNDSTQSLSSSNIVTIIINELFLQLNDK
jgi:hypothetical protein